MYKIDNIFFMFAYLKKQALDIDSPIFNEV